MVKFLCGHEGMSSGQVFDKEHHASVPVLLQLKVWAVSTGIYAGNKECWECYKVRKGLKV